MAVQARTMHRTTPTHPITRYGNSSDLLAFAGAAGWQASRRFDAEIDKPADAARDGISFADGASRPNGGAILPSPASGTPWVLPSQKPFSKSNRKETGLRKPTGIVQHTAVRSQSPAIRLSSAVIAWPTGSTQWVTDPRREPAALPIVGHRRAICGRPSHHR